MISNLIVLDRRVFLIGAASASQGEGERISAAFGIRLEPQADRCPAHRGG